MIKIYWSAETKSWVRATKEADGEWTHTSGFSSEEAAILNNNYIKFYSEPPLPSFLQEENKNNRPKGLWDKYGMPSFLSE